jgi:hypothetical protein
MLPSPKQRPDGESVTKNSKNSLFAMPLKGPEAEVLGREDDFHGSGVN